MTPRGEEEGVGSGFLEIDPGGGGRESGGPPPQHRKAQLG